MNPIKLLVSPAGRIVRVVAGAVLIVGGLSVVGGVVGAVLALVGLVPLLAGSNWCDVGFEVDAGAPGNRVVVIAALDNLMKGAAGSAVQAMNLMMGWDERAGLTFPGLHPA